MGNGNENIEPYIGCAGHAMGQCFGGWFSKPSRHK